MKWYGAWFYGVHRTCTETAAVSCGTSHASAVSTPLQWIFKNTSHSCRITCEHSESAQSQRIELYEQPLINQSMISATTKTVFHQSSILCLPLFSFPWNCLQPWNLDSSWTFSTQAAWSPAEVCISLNSCMLLHEILQSGRHGQASDHHLGQTESFLGCSHPWSQQ